MTEPPPSNMDPHVASLFEGVSSAQALFEIVCYFGLLLVSREKGRNKSLDTPYMIPIYPPQSVFLVL